MMLSGAQILINELVAHGVDIVFGYPGGMVIDIYDELYKNADRIKHVLTSHEQGASHAADGYARISGKPGVVIATSGPGATNIVTGIANAYLDSVPLVAITGNVAVPMLGRDSFQEVDIVGVSQPIVKHSFVVRDVEKLEVTLKEAFTIATTGRRGPVLVDIPKSVQTAMCKYNGKPVSFSFMHVKADNDLDAAIEAIKNSQKPYIYAGGGIIAGNAEKELLELSKRLSAPVGLSMMGLTAIPNSYPLNLGMSGMHGRYAATKAQSTCDLMIAAGVRFSDRATGNVQEYTKNCKVIHIDIDLAEFGKNVQSKIGLCGDVKEILNQLLKRIPAQENSEWLNEIEEYKKAEETEQNRDFSPQNIIETVNAHFNEDTIVATDVGQHQMWVMQHYRFEKPKTLLTSGGLGAMGFGLGAAIGGCLASGKKRTLLFTGDGSFSMNFNELATAVSEKLPLVIILLNNGVLGMVRQWQQLFYDKRYSNTTRKCKTDFVQLGQAFGIKSFSVEDINGLNDVLNKHKNTDMPLLINCLIDEDELVFPMIPAGGSVKNMVLKRGDIND